MAEETPAPEQPSEIEEPLSTEDPEERDVERCQYDGCPRLSELGSYHCIFHMLEEEKEAAGAEGSAEGVKSRRGLTTHGQDIWELCMEMFYKLVEEGVGDFRGFVLKDLDLSGKVLEQKVDFSNAEFFGEANFSKVEFEDNALFWCVTFRGRAVFDVAVFHKQVEFTLATFADEAVFLKTVFNKEANFNLSKFNGGANFFRTKLKDKTIFKGCKFDGSAFFEMSVCSNEITFESVKFLKEANFNRIQFKKADFTNANFSTRVIFSPNKEDKTSNIPTFTSANFNGAYFEKGGSFDECVIREGSFENASIQNVSFHRVNLDNVKFAGAQMDQAYLADAEWKAPEKRSFPRKVIDWLSVPDPRFKIREEEEAEKIPKKEREKKTQTLVKAESTYRRLKHTLANEGDYEKAGHFYIYEMLMKRKRYKNTKGFGARWNQFWNWFYSITCGYGERPKRVVFNGVVIILIFAIIYTTFDAVEKAGEEEKELSFWDALYFSVVTFTTLGYGDYSPGDEVYFKVAAGLEAFAGAFTIALFVLVFGRQVMR